MYIAGSNVYLYPMVLPVGMVHSHYLGYLPNIFNILLKKTIE